MTNTIELSFFGIDQDGKAQRSTRSQFNLTLRPESFTRVKTGGLRVNPRLTLEPGRYQIRVGARESVGSRVGTVFYDLLVPDFRKEPLMLSGVLITAASAQAAMTAHARSGGPETAARTGHQPPDASPATTRVTVFAEIYDNSSSRQPRQIDTTVTLVSESGQEVFARPRQREQSLDPLGTRRRRRWTTYGLARDIPLDGRRPRAGIC